MKDLKKYAERGKRLSELIEERRELKRALWKMDEEVWELLKGVRPVFTKRGYEILKLRLTEGGTLDAVGRVYSITRERVRHIEERELAKLAQLGSENKS